MTLGCGCKAKGKELCRKSMKNNQAHKNQKKKKPGLYTSQQVHLSGLAILTQKVHSGQDDKTFAAIGSLFSTF